MTKLWVPLFSHFSYHVSQPVQCAPISRRTIKKMGLAGSKRTANERDESNALQLWDSDDEHNEDEEDDEEEDAPRADEEIISSEEEIAPYDANDPFYSTS